jgi:hypothetical protein
VAHISLHHPYHKLILAIPCPSISTSQTARRQYEPDTTCQQQVAAEAQELSKVGGSRVINNASCCR